MIRTAVFAAASLVATPLAADEVAELHAALGLPRLVEVMRQEGIAYGAQIAADLFPGQDSEAWQEMVTLIYDSAWMEAATIAGLRAELAGEDVAAMTAYFTSEPGRTIAALEISAREALLDEAVEEAASEAAAEGSDTPRMALIRRYIEANDLVENNVSGALNANYAFYAGLTEGGAFDETLTESEILTQVWAQEPQIRQSTTDWVESFLFLAYAPLGEAQLEDYIAFSQSPTGQAMNAALFAAFDPMFDEISHALGLAAARVMAGQSL